MRTRALLSACAVALVATSCAQPEPQVLSEAPRSTTATDLSATTSPTEGESRPGRFIARCATEADGGTPGMTVFTDGTEGVTDHCLSRYYIGVQPAPGALYVPDEDAGTYAPSGRVGAVADTGGWTPAQPRTDTGPDGLRPDDPTREQAPTTEPESRPDADEGSMPGAPVTSPGGTTPTTAPPETPGEPGTGTPTDGETSPPGDGTSPQEPTDTTVPTVTETAAPPASSIETSVTSTAPSDPTGLSTHSSLVVPESHVPLPALPGSATFGG